jgi:uncharacterized protein YcfJ
MDKSMMKGIVAGGLATVVLGAGGVTGYRALTAPKFAEVVAVHEVTETVRVPTERCEDVPVRRQAAVKDPHRIAGTVVGGLAGGLLGSAVGGGSGKTIATVAGAAAGGYAGNQVQRNLQQRDVVSTTQRRCRTHDETSEQVVGYDVTYRYRGKDDTVRTAFRPGGTLPVKDGVVVTSGGTESAP